MRDVGAKYSAQCDEVLKSSGSAIEETGRAPRVVELVDAVSALCVSRRTVNGGHGKSNERLTTSSAILFRRSLVSCATANCLRSYCIRKLAGPTTKLNDHFAMLLRVDEPVGPARPFALVSDEQFW